MQLAISRQSDRQTIASAAIIHICHSFTSQRLTTRTAQIVATEMFCCSVMIISYFVQLLLLAYLICMHFIILCVLVVNCCALAYVCVFVIFIWNVFCSKGNAFISALLRRHNSSYNNNNKCLSSCSDELKSDFEPKRWCMLRLFYIPFQFVLFAIFVAVLTFAFVFVSLTTMPQMPRALWLKALTFAASPSQAAQVLCLELRNRVEVFISNGKCLRTICWRVCKEGWANDMHCSCL